MSVANKLKGLYVISDDVLTPDETLLDQVEQALLGGASIVQLRDKKNSDDVIKQKIKNYKNYVKNMMLYLYLTIKLIWQLSWSVMDFISVKVTTIDLMR